MRKYHQRQLLEIMGTIKEANYLIERYIKNGENEVALKLLIDCHEVAVSIGRRIEELKGEDTITVSYLEEYCDILYKAGLVIRENSKELKKTIKLLHNQIIKIEDSILNDIKPDKFEIVFFPYKASMWDSMESIWLAAKNDPMCDVHVVPIPYYKRQLNGTLGEMCYEGGLYPNNIPVIDWKDYKPEERWPDIIIIHNPYDEGNYVTSIHPDYYSSRLKNYTDLLCYVPYFVASDSVAEHFVLCPGVIYADRVFLESEKIRDDYSRIFKEFCKKNHLNDRFGVAEEKFIASGSPKLDKIKNSNPEDFCIPDMWQRKIGKVGGTQKPIVLYNTSVGAILKGDKEYIRKLRNVFELFKKRSDVTLWWRPHPLSETTYDTMRPYLLEEYKQLVEDYKRDEIGIYDDTADLHRAIQLSSVLYTDYSSLIPMYQHAGKPVIVRKIKNTADYLTFENFLDDEDCFWISGININGLFKVNKKTLKARYIGMFEGENSYGRLFSDIVEYRNKIYFIPRSAKSMAIYDLETYRFSSVKIEDPKSNIGAKYDPEVKFAFAVPYQEFLYLFPRNYPDIIKYNCFTGEVKILDECSGIINEDVDNSYSLFQNGIIERQYVTMFCSRAKLLVRFDMESDKLVILDRFIGCHTYGRLEYDGDSYWFAPLSEGAPILKWNLETKEKMSLSKLPEGLRSGKKPFSCSAIMGDYLYLLPGVANKSIMINIKTNNITACEEFSEESMVDNPEIEQWMYHFLKQVESKLYAFSAIDGMFIEYIPSSGFIRKEHVTVDLGDEETCVKLRDYYLQSVTGKLGKFPMQETDWFGINDFMDFFGDKDILKPRESIDARVDFYKDENSGERIFYHCKETVMTHLYK